MALSSEPRPPLTVIVELPDSQRDEAGREVLDSVATYGQRLLDGLHVPAALSVQAEFTGPADRTNASATLRIGDDAVRFANPAGLSPAALGGAIALKIHDSRDLVITQPVVHAVWRRWFAGEAECPAPLVDECQWLLREALRYGLHLDRVRPAIERLRRHERPIDLASLFEETVAETAPQVGIRISPTQHALAVDRETGQPRKLGGEQQDLGTLLALMQEGFFWELGLYLRPALVVPDEALQAPSLQVCWNDVVLPPAHGLDRGELLVNATLSKLKGLGFEGRPAINPTSGGEAAIVSDEARDRCVKAGLTTWGPEEYLVLAMSAGVRAHAGALVTARLTDLYLLQLQRVFPRLVEETVQRIDRLGVTRMLRCLLDEGISIRDLRRIFEAVISVSGITTADSGARIVFQPDTGIVYPAAATSSDGELRPADFAECARTRLRQYISHKYTRGASTLVTYLLDSGLERRITSARGVLSADEADAVLSAVRNEIGSLPPSAQVPVILTTIETRRHVRHLIERELPTVAVLSYQELSPDLNIQPIARIGT